MKKTIYRGNPRSLKIYEEVGYMRPHIFERAEYALGESRTIPKWMLEKFCGDTPQEAARKLREYRREQKAKWEEKLKLVQEKIDDEQLKIDELEAKWRI